MTKLNNLATLTTSAPTNNPTSIFKPYAGAISLPSLPYGNYPHLFDIGDDDCLDKLQK
jgi:hypothetical protein